MIEYAVGQYVIFADDAPLVRIRPALYAALLMIENITYGLGGQMAPAQRAAIAAGHPHMILRAPDGRRYGAVGTDVRPA